MNEPMLRALNLRKTYILGKRSLEVLRGIDLEVGRGDFLALRGSSGAGKSTLLYLLGGLDVPNQGEVHVAGRNLRGLSRRELARVRNKEVGFIFQAYYLLPELDAVENVCLPARMARVASAEAETRARMLLERVGLKDRMEHKPYELSGGEQQRVAIARALINDPDIILADEPTGNLDSHTGADIIELLCQIGSQKTLVIATHDPKVAAKAPRVIELVDGEISRSSLTDNQG